MVGKGLTLTFLPDYTLSPHSMSYTPARAAALPDTILREKKRVDGEKRKKGRGDSAGGIKVCVHVCVCVRVCVGRGE